MPKITTPKTAAQVATLSKTKGTHAVGGVPGLCLQSNGSTAISWVLLMQVHGRQVARGIGSYRDYGLADARQRAQALRIALLNGTEPAPPVRAATFKGIPFRKAADAYLEIAGVGFKNDHQRTGLIQQFEAHVHPYIGNMPAHTITTADVHSLLAAGWATKTNTFSRLRNRVEGVLDMANVQGHMPVGWVNPAAWKGRLEHLLPSPSKIATTTHHAALPYEQVRDYYAQLCRMEGNAALALRWLILTASRSGETRGMQWSELAADGATWTIPATRMKMKIAFTVPLNDAHTRLLKQVPRMAGDTVFAAPRGGILTDMALLGIIRLIAEPVTAHGFRTTFRTWAAEQTDVSADLAEQCLAHQIGNAVSRAYARTDVLEKRRHLMQAWAQYVTGNAT